MYMSILLAYFAVHSRVVTSHCHCPRLWTTCAVLLSWNFCGTYCNNLIYSNLHCTANIFSQQGRLWVGSMGHEPEPAKPAQEQGSLVCVGLIVLHCKVDKHVII